MGIEMIQIVLAIFYLLNASPTWAVDSPQTSRYTQTELLKNWVLSRCLARVFSAETDRHDAEIAASAYLEFGKAPIESYELGEKLVDKYLSRTYSGSVEGNYNTMKCIDLFYSEEVKAWANRATRRN
jgi:hypothetical protein